MASKRAKPADPCVAVEVASEPAVCWLLALPLELLNLILEHFTLVESIYECHLYAVCKMLRAMYGPKRRMAREMYLTGNHYVPEFPSITVAEAVEATFEPTKLERAFLRFMKQWEAPRNTKPLPRAYAKRDNGDYAVLWAATDKGARIGVYSGNFPVMKMVTMGRFKSATPYRYNMAWHPSYDHLLIVMCRRKNGVKAYIRIVNFKLRTYWAVPIDIPITTPLIVEATRVVFYCGTKMYIL